MSGFSSRADPRLQATDIAVCAAVEEIGVMDDEIEREVFRVEG